MGASSSHSSCIKGFGSGIGIGVGILIGRDRDKRFGIEIGLNGHRYFEIGLMAIGILRSSLWEDPGAKLPFGVYIATTNSLYMGNSQGKRESGKEHTEQSSRACIPGVIRWHRLIRSSLKWEGRGPIVGCG